MTSLDIGPQIESPHGTKLRRFPLNRQARASGDLQPKKESNMASEVESGSAGQDLLQNLALNAMTDQEKYSKPIKYDKEAWRGEDDDNNEEQHFPKPINVQF
jgi:hypothetical protein